MKKWLFFGLLVLALGCSSKEQKPPRFRCIGYPGATACYKDTVLFEDTETGDVWMKTVGGMFSDTRWVKVSNGTKEEL